MKIRKAAKRQKRLNERIKDYEDMTRRTDFANHVPAGSYHKPGSQNPHKTKGTAQRKKVRRSR